MMKLWTFFLGSSQLVFFWGGRGSFILYIYTFEGFFLRSKFRIGIFFFLGGVLYVKYFLGMPDVPDIFLGVNSR